MLRINCLGQQFLLFSLYVLSVRKSWCQPYTSWRQSRHQLQFIYDPYVICWQCWLMLFILYPFQQKENAWFKKIQEAILRTTGPNIGMFVLILMHFSCRFQIWKWNLQILNCWKLNEKIDLSCAIKLHTERVNCHDLILIDMHG